MSEQQPTWDDPYWDEPGDNAFQRRLRRHQSWWRAVHLERSAGTQPRRSKPVASTLGEDWEPEDNLFTEAARASLQVTLDRRSASAERGLVQRERVDRNLLSSQPLCFNLFGYLSMHPEALLPWVRTFVPSANEVLEVQLEAAPLNDATSGSAFDAFVTYRRSDRRLGFLGVECKYAEDLEKSQRDKARQLYLDETREGPWRDGSEERLNAHGLRQFWYNTLLAQRVLAAKKEARYAQAHSVVAALAEDHKARAAVADVGAELRDPSLLRFSSIEDVVASVQGHETWKKTFRDRYLNLYLSEPADRRTDDLA